MEKFIARDTVEQMMEELEREPDAALVHAHRAGLGGSRGTKGEWRGGAPDLDGGDEVDTGRGEGEEARGVGHGRAHTHVLHRRQRGDDVKRQARSRVKCSMTNRGNVY